MGKADEASSARCATADTGCPRLTPDAAPVTPFAADDVIYVTSRNDYKMATGRYRRRMLRCRGFLKAFEVCPEHETLISQR